MVYVRPPVSSAITHRGVADLGGPVEVAAGEGLPGTAEELDVA